MSVFDSIIIGFNQSFITSFNDPSAFQRRVIVPILQGNDVIAQGQAGTGKTSAFSISVLQQLDTDLKATQALVITPTRELAQQTQRLLIGLGAQLSFECRACIGGPFIREDLAKLQEGVHIVLGSPGRIVDMINRNALKTDHVKIVCLDETDEMFSRGFRVQLEDIFVTLPQTRQIAVMTGSVTPEVLSFAKMYMRDPVCMLVRRED